MAQKEFTVYNGVKYEKIIGEEIPNAPGHYKVNVESNEIITVLGTWLDNTTNMAQFEKDFYECLDLSAWSNLVLPYNFILIGNNIVYSFNHSNNNYYTGAPDLSQEKLFNILIDIITNLGYVNQAPEFIYDNNILCKKIKFTLINKITQEPFEVYFIPLDYISIKIGDK